MKTKFYLRTGSTKTTICFEYRNGVQEKFRASTGFEIRALKDWDSRKQKMKLPSSTINANLINSKLTEFESKLNNLIYHENINAIQLASVKSLFQEVFEIKKASKVLKTSKSIAHQNLCFAPDEINPNLSNDFMEYFKWFLEFYSKNNSPYSKKILSSGSLKTHRNCMEFMKKYLADRKLKTLYFDDINRKFYHDLMNYMNDRNLSRNYMGTIIQKIKTLMGYALDEDRHTNLEFKKTYFSKISEVVHHPYLSIEELKQIQELTLHCKEMEISRDIFLVGCYTGLRIGDLLRFIRNPNYVMQDGRKFIMLKQSKTSGMVYIPLNSEIVKITEKYNGNLPDYIHQSNINRNIKSICKRAKITEPYKYTRTQGGVPVEYELPKYKFVTTHTARRSFCTNAYKQGILVQDIMAISGHKTERVFLSYIKVDLLENASRISNYGFFS
jgi:integrase